MLSLCATPETSAATRLTPRPNGSRAELRQLRHLTKNALQRILAQVLEAPGLERSAAGRSLARDIERRIRLSAAISDALFGFTQSPEPLPARLRTLSRSVVDLYADPAQMIRLDVAVSAVLPRPLEQVVLQIAHELIGNAVKHGLHMRLLGRLEVRLEIEAEGIAVLTVANDGWPLDGELALGDGLDVVAELATSCGGAMRIKNGMPTTIEVRLPVADRT